MRSASGCSASGTPRPSATPSRVRSSLVGPSPPTVNTRTGLRATAPATSRAIASSSSRTMTVRAHHAAQSRDERAETVAVGIENVAAELLVARRHDLDRRCPGRGSGHRRASSVVIAVVHHRLQSGRGRVGRQGLAPVGARRKRRSPGMKEEAATIGDPPSWSILPGAIRRAARETHRHPAARAR